MEEKPSRLRALFDKYREIIMYCIFGVTTTLVSWVTYWFFMLILPFDYDVKLTLFKKVFDFNLNIFASSVISWIIAVSVAFVTNKIWVFESKSWEKKLVWGEAVTFVGGRMLTGAIEVFAVPFLVGCGFDQTLFGVKGLPIKIIVSMGIVVLNYFLSKFISFNISDKIDTEGEENREKNQ